MRNKLLTTLLLVLSVISVCGQNITRYEADSLLRLLSKSKSDTGRFNLSLKIACFHIFKPGEFKKDLDSAKALINDAKRLKAGIESKEADGYLLLVESYLIGESGHRETAIGMIEKAIQLLNDGKDKSLVGEACLELSYCYTYYNTSDNIDAAAKKRHWIERALEAFQQSANLEQKAFCLTQLGELDIINNEEAKALGELKLALATYDSIHYDKTQGVYSLLARLYDRYADYSNAIRYELMALKAAEKVNDSSMMLSQINNDMGGFFKRQGENEKALKFYNNGLNIAERHNDTSSIFLFAMNITDAYVTLNRPLDALRIIEHISKKYARQGNLAVEYFTAVTYINIYISLKVYPKAQSYCVTLLDIAKSPEVVTSDIVAIYSLIIRFYIASKQYSSALTYLIKNKALTHELGSPLEISENYHQWFRLDSAQGNYKSALYNLAEFHKINDSIFNQTKSKQNQLLQVEYETEKKDDNIRMKEQKIQVLTQHDQLRQASLNKAKFVRNVTFGGILMLMVITGLVYKQYRNKQKSNRIITQKNQVITHKNELLQHLLKEKEWLLKEVHHRVKNNLHTVICLLESQAAYLENDALKAIEKSQHRIYAMSLIHQKLYQSEDVKTIDMKQYLPEFIQYLSDSFGTSNQVRFQLDIEPLKLSTVQAIPIALIINEAVTNSIKYAFPHNFPYNGKGEISIAMHQAGDQIKLVVADNGIGMDPNIKDTELNSLGLELIKGLSEEIRAHIEFENNMGTKISLIFEHDTLMEFEEHLAMPLDKEVHI